MKLIIKIILLMLLLGTVNLCRAQWVQVGSDIDGDIASESGSSISLNSNGSVIAISSPSSGENNSFVKVYQKNSGEWLQIGSDIEGRGWPTVDLNSDGTTIVIGTPGDNDEDRDVKIYQYISGNWLQIGSTINGEAYSDGFGSNVSISSDGSIVAVAAPNNHQPHTEGGRVKIYKNIGAVWTQIGENIDGSADYENCGTSIDLNYDGSIIAIGSPKGDYYLSGKVRVFKNISGVWSQYGNIINGEAADRFGSKVSISSDGSILAIGTSCSMQSVTGINYIKVLKKVAGTWVQLGAKIEIEEDSPYSIALNPDGTKIVIGEKYNDEGGYNSGRVRVFENINNTWLQVNQSLFGEDSQTDFGHSVSINSNGNTIAVGAPDNEDNGFRAGHVRVFEDLSTGFGTQLSKDKYSIYPNPTKSKITIDCDGLEQIEIVDITGRTVKHFSSEKDQMTIDLSNQTKGIYLFKIYTKKGISTQKIVLE